MFLFLLIFTLLPKIAFCNDSVNFFDAEKMLYAGKTIEAIRHLSNLCDKEDTDACKLLGFSYINGRYNIPINEANGILWYTRCADIEKNFTCKNELAKIYLMRGLYPEAFELYNLSAQKNNSEGEYVLGLMYYNGLGVHPNYEKALKWLRKSAHNKKNPKKAAQCKLTEMSYYGIGMLPSIKDTNYWLNQCDNPFIRFQQNFYQNEREAAYKILQENNLSEALSDWDDFTLKGSDKSNKIIRRDEFHTFGCILPSKLASYKKTNKYVIKIFNEKYHRNFDITDTHAEKQGTGYVSFELCNKTFYTTSENYRIIKKSLYNQSIIKISKYINYCTTPEITEICAINLPWEDEE